MLLVGLRGDAGAVMGEPRPEPEDIFGEGVPTALPTPPMLPTGVPICGVPKGTGDPALLWLSIPCLL